MIILRPYQAETVHAIWNHIRSRDDNPCAVIPTGGGKTPVLATLCKDAVVEWHGRVLILAHVKELLEQAKDKLNRICPEVPVGIYSAGLKRRDTHDPVIVAGIQSVYRRACDLDAFDIIIIDEAHLIPPEGDGMYRTFLNDSRIINPNLRVIGLTATPFRMTTGSICAPENILNHVCYEIGIRELIVLGYLTRLVTKASRITIDTCQLRIRAGEFVASEVEEMMDDKLLVQLACDEIVELTSDRKSCLIFAAGVKHGEHVADVLRTKHSASVATVFSETGNGERSRVLTDFRDGKLKYLVNVNVLTTGFDAPNIDCVVLLRPTMSPGLYYQMVGRGFRVHEGKENCLVLDFGGNVLRHGPVDMLKVKSNGKGEGGDAPAKECPECQTVIAAGYSRCPECGYAFPPPERSRHEAKASDAPILSGEPVLTEHEVIGTTYHRHMKKNAGPDHPPTLRVDYQINLQKHISEYLGFEHTGFARDKAAHWWKRRSMALVPETVEEALLRAESGAVAPTTAITVLSRPGEFDRIEKYKIGEIPPWREPGEDEVESDPDEDPVWLSDVEVPF